MKISRQAAAIAPSPTLSLNEMAKKLQAQGNPVINLGVGEPENLAPLSAIEKATERLTTRKIKYTAAGGTSELKDAIIRYTANNYHRTPSLNNVIVTSGAKQAIYNALIAILDPGEEVILLAPYWVSYPEMVMMAGGSPIVVAPTARTLTHRIEDVRTALTPSTRAIILNNPNNPSGVLSPPEFVSILVKLCEEMEIYLILDDIYHKLIFGGTPWVPGYDFTQKPIDSSTIIVINGISKSYGMTGFRIGWAVAAAELIKVMTNIQSQTTSGVSIVLQDAALGALQGDQDVVTRLCNSIKINRDLVVAELLTIPNITVVRPEGAFYCLPDFSVYNPNSLVLSQFILEKALVAVVPGSAFGMEGHLRISYAGDTAQILEGISRIREVLGSG